MDSQCAGNPIARARKNLAALEALAAAEERGRATSEEIAAMEAYSGWGGAQKAFSEKAEGEWGEIRDRLKELLSEDEFASQRHTVLTAFYTPAPVIGAIYDALREAGIGQGDTPAAILEPGCGTGNFMRLAPADLALDFHGVELDSISARIAQALCPEAHITAAGLEECRVSPASFDAAIGNVPYSGDIKIDGMPIHDYFIKKSVEAVRPGGIVAVLTSRYTLDKNSTATRRALAEQAELLGAVRLPAETFRRQAGTEALSDILLLRRRPEPIALSEDELPEWVETSPFEDTVNINRYFNEHPGRARARRAPDAAGLERTPRFRRRRRKPDRRRPRRARPAAQDAPVGEQPEPHHLALRGGRPRAYRRSRPRRPPHRLDQLAGARPPRARGLRRPSPDRAGGLRRATLERLHRQPAARPARPRAGQLPFRGAPAARSRPRPPTRSNTSSATAAFPMRSLAPSSPPAALSPTTARTTSRPSNLSPASRLSAPNARCTAAPRPGSRQSRTACASRAPSGRHRTPSSTCSASSGSSARMSA